MLPLLDLAVTFAAQVFFQQHLEETLQSPNKPRGVLWRLSSRAWAETASGLFAFFLPETPAHTTSFLEVRQICILLPQAGGSARGSRVLIEGGRWGV